MHEINNTLNSKTLKVVNWIRSNKLTIDIPETRYMVSSSLMHQLPSIDNVLLEQMEQCKFLWVIIDTKLKWSVHIGEARSLVYYSKFVGF